VTLGAGLTVRGQSGHLTPRHSDSRFVNLGTIASDGGGAIRIGSRQDGTYGNAGSLENEGTLSASGSGSVLYVPVASWNNSAAGQITASAGGVIALDQNGVNSGPITANGGTVTLNGSWTNTGELTASSNGVLNLQGTWTNSGSITAASSTVNYNGAWSEGGDIGLTGSQLNFRGSGVITVPVHGDAASGVNLYGTVGSLTVTGGARLGIAGGTIQSGTLTLDAGQALHVDGHNSTLSNVGVNGDVDVRQLNGFLVVTGGLTLNGAAYLGTVNGSHWGGLRLNGTQTIGGTGSIVLGGHWLNAVLIHAAATTVTLDEKLTVRGQSGHLTPQHSDSRFVNLGTIASDSGGAIRIGSRQDGTYGNAGSLENEGTLSASGSGSVLYVPVANWNNTAAGQITASAGGVIALDQNGVNSGPITANGGTVTLDGSWTNTGELTASSNGVLNLQGTWTNSGSITAASSTVNYNGAWSEGGDIGLTGSQLNFRGSGVITVPVHGDAASGVNLYGTVGSLTVTGGARLGIAGGTIQSGTLTLDAGQALYVDGHSSTLSNVAVNGDVDVRQLNGFLVVTGGLTLNGAAYLGTVNGSHWGGLRLNGTQTIGGTGSIVLGGHWLNAVLIHAAATTVTLDEKLTVRGQSGHLTPQHSDSRFVNLGTIASDSGGAIRIGSRQDGTYGNAGSLENEGTLSASGSGSVLYVPVANWNNTAAGQITASAGIVSLDGTWSSSGTLTSYISGHTPPNQFGIPGVDYGQFIFAGSFDLEGTLKVQLSEPYVAKLGEKFLVIDNRTAQPIPTSLVFDGDGLSVAYAAGDGNDVVVTAPTVNVAPVADAGGPYTVPFGGSLVLAATATDPNGSGDIVSIQWDLDGDGIFGETGSADAPNGDEVGRTPRFLPTGLPAYSSHTISLRVTDQGGLVAEDQATVAVTVVPELAISSSDITFSPVNPAVGQVVTINATVRNLGQVAANNVVVRFLDFATTLGEVTITQLDAGASTQVFLPTGFSEASHRLITVQIDPADTILELNEQNNEASLVLQVGQPAQSGAAIVATAGPVVAYQGQTAWVTGQAFYDFTTVPGTNDFPVQGARVTATILDSAGQSRGVFTGALTNVSGAFSQIILAPNEIDLYTLRMEVTDGTAVTTFITTLDVREYVVPPPPPPSPPPSPPGGPVDDVAVRSEDILFSEINPGIGEEITILARLWHTGPTSGIVAVTVNDIFPVAGSLHAFPIGTTTAHLPASSGEWVYVGITVPWTNTADGAHIIQVVAAPEYAQPTGNDQATRLIYVGTSPANLSITKSVELLVDADGNGLVSPGDTLRYAVHYGNTGGTEVTGASIIDDYDEALLDSPFGLSLPGAIDGGTITWSLGTIAGGAAGVVSYDVQIKPRGEFPLEVRTISNYALLDTDQTASLAASATIDVVTIDPHSSVSGRVFDDRNNDGLFNGADAGIEGVVLMLVNANEETVATATTDSTGAYLFSGVFPAGVYRIVESQPAGFLDGKETAGTLGGTVDNSQDSKHDQRHRGRTGRRRDRVQLRRDRALANSGASLGGFQQ
jgi:hypothetical protein